MSSAEALIAAATGLGAKAPEDLVNVINGYRALSEAAKPATDPNRAILDAAANGTLTAESARELATSGVIGKLVSEHLVTVASQANRRFVEKFHELLEAGAADAILNDLRPAFDEAAANIAATLELVDIRTPDSALVANATAEQLDAWRSLPKHVTKISSIAAVATRFGMFGNFALIDDPRDKDVMLRGGEMSGLDDRAVMCTTGDLILFSRTFLEPNPDVRSSPWLRVQPKLHTIAEARERVRAYAESAWAAIYAARPKTGRVIDGNSVVYDELRNPFALSEATA
ncbi:hypothetical protein [Mycobacterium colombiense]|uniref:hypothetical protein n=1 Tax=Mycobacterium colombiense TaxID=339268 RepID=UPI001152BA55|nr:hypothetical protein [Mycobacterium colombiense]